MPEPTSDEVSRLIALRDPSASERLLSLVYEQLRAIAQQQMANERPGHTLQATALVHEAYLRLLGDQPAGWANRAHFFHAAAEAMRRILIEHARARARLKRGGRDGQPARAGPLSVVDLADDADLEKILSFDDAIRRLETENEQLAAIVRLRFYAGLTVEDTADALGLSAATVKRRWVFARALLYQRLGDDPS